MVKTTLLTPICLLLAISIAVMVILSCSTSHVSDVRPTDDAATTDIPVAISSSAPTRLATATPTAISTDAPTATPTTTNTAKPTRCSTPVPDDLLTPVVVMFRRSNPEYLDLEVRPRIATEDMQPATPTPPRATPMPAVLDTVQPPTLAGKALVVDQDTQVLRVYEDGVEIRTLLVSTGVPSLYTPAFLGQVGHYVSTIYGYGGLSDNAWYIFTAGGNIYIHSAPYTLSEGMKVYEGLEFLGVQPSSHGCIRLHPSDAEWLVSWNPLGVPILITSPHLNGGE